MSLPIILTEEAEDEYREAYSRYENARTGAGRKLEANLRATFHVLSRNPLIGRVVLADVRMKVVPRHPYTIYYRILADRISVLAVFHTSRDPGEWRRRVEP